MIPKGWVEYTDWSCSCRFYVPGATSALPAPIVWEKCPVQPPGVECEAMRIDWSSNQIPIGLTPMLDHAPDGAARLSFLRRVDPSGSVPDYGTYIVADADGPARSALISVLGAAAAVGGGCWPTEQALSGGKHVLEIYGDDSNGAPMSDALGAVGGAVDELHPKVLLRSKKTSPFAESYATSAKWLSRVTWPIVMYAYPWADLSKEVFVTSSAVDPESLTFSQLVMHEDALFFTTATSYLSGINSWNPVDGARPFVRFINDGTRGAGNLGTDGKDLVWSYGEGKKPDEEIYPVRSIMTAPFTTDPQALKPKRLRSDPDVGIAVDAFQVACGRAAHGGATQNVVVVRLSDGWSWPINNIGPDFSLEEIIGITCDHVYGLARIGGRWNVARIKLSSLGPGAAPD